jgi:hypothetical protein
MRSLQGALIIAGVFQAVVGFFGIWRVFIRLVVFFFCSHAVNQTSNVVSVPAPVLTLSLLLRRGDPCISGS